MRFCHHQPLASFCHPAAKAGADMENTKSAVHAVVSNFFLMFDVLLFIILMSVIISLTGKRNKNLPVRPETKKWR